MAYASLRDFLAALEREGQVLRIKDEVRLEPDLGAATLANYLRATWGGQKGDVMPAAVRALR